MLSEEPSLPNSPEHQQSPGDASPHHHAAQSPRVPSTCNDAVWEFSACSLCRWVCGDLVK